METNNLLAPLFFVLIGLMGGAILKFGLKKMPLLSTIPCLPYLDGKLLKSTVLSLS